MERREHGAVQVPCRAGEEVGTPGRPSHLKGELQAGDASGAEDQGTPAGCRRDPESDKAQRVAHARFMLAALSTL